MKAIKKSNIFKYINEEKHRQMSHVELIASENFTSQDILNCQGSILTNKYAEGYPGKRYYGGCQYVDKIEQHCINMVKQLFNAEHANVQPHSGSQANLAMYHAFLKPNDRVLALNLDDGGHLTHGFKLNESGSLYSFKHYKTNPKTFLLDYDEVEKLAMEFRPKLILAGASAYPRKINFKKFRDIANKVNAIFAVDMAHIAGLVATGYHENPVKYADVVTSTTHKSLRGPRGGFILCKQKYAKQIDRAVFPGTQGGPLMHVIAGKAICFEEASTLEFKKYTKQIIDNCQSMIDVFKKYKYSILTDGSDNHLFLLNVKKTFGITGKIAEAILDKVNITTNKNMIPYDDESPFKTSGLRIGTPAITTLGFKKNECKFVAECIHKALTNRDDDNVLMNIKDEIVKLMKNYSLPN